MAKKRAITKSMRVVLTKRAMAPAARAMARVMR